MTETEVIRSMVLSFRLLELQDLLLFAGKSKLGKKSELQVSSVYEIYIVRNILFLEFKVGNIFSKRNI